MSHADRSPSIAISIFALVLAALLAAAIAFFLITFNGPPPKEPPRTLEGIAFALKTGSKPSEPGLPLRIAESTTAPSGPHRAPAAEAKLAAILAVPVGDVRVFADRQPSDIGSAFVGDFITGMRHGEMWRIATNPPRALFTQWHWITLGAMLGLILILAVPTWGIARALSRPLR